MNFKFLASVVSVSSAWLISSTAMAFCLGSGPPQSSSSTTLTGNGTYHYLVAAHGGNNGCGPADPNAGYMTDYYIPYFADMGITNISLSSSSDQSWTYQIEQANNRFRFGGEEIHFSRTPPSSGQLYASFFDRLEFEFDALFDGVKGPYQEGLLSVTDSNRMPYTFNGDPLLPGSPNFIDALDSLQPSGNVPEPTSIALLGLGLLGFAASRWKSNS